MIKLFNKWDISEIKIEEPGLKGYINLKQVLVPKTFGRHAKKPFHRTRNLNIVERFMNHLNCPGHRGKKHLLSSNQCSGKSITIYNIMKEALDIIEKRTNKNPVEVLVRAIENVALREEITSFQVGGIIARKSVITSPQRRVDVACRLMTQGSFQRASRSPKSMATAIADEIMGAYNADSSKSHALKEKERIEREATSAR